MKGSESQKVKVPIASYAPTINISISQLGVTAGAVVASVVYTTSMAASDATVFTTDTGIRLLGKAASIGTTFIAGNVAGRIVDTISIQFADIAKGHISTTTKLGAAATAIAAGAGTAIIITISGVLVKHSAAGVAYLSKKALDKIMLHYGRYSAGKTQQIQLNAFLVNDAIVIDDPSEPDYVMLGVEEEGGQAEAFDSHEL